ncbi:uncharacterized protein LOC131928650 [Physella acuta]|uniref:uncharacterized protein LOC131928650 n=1 Tax=Physella acuta TaxID=109671 RepID=UPI0027DDAACA|nr:uncharacterized protein LOC131928650 [Physella acuta]
MNVKTLYNLNLTKEEGWTLPKLSMWNLREQDSMYIRVLLYFLDSPDTPGSTECRGTPEDQSGEPSLRSNAAYGKRLPVIPAHYLVYRKATEKEPTTIHPTTKPVTQTNSTATTTRTTTATTTKKTTTITTTPTTPTPTTATTTTTPKPVYFVPTYVPRIIQSSTHLIVTAPPTEGGSFKLYGLQTITGSVIITCELMHMHFLGIPPVNTTIWHNDHVLTTRSNSRKVSFSLPYQSESNFSCGIEGKATECIPPGDRRLVHVSITSNDIVVMLVTKEGVDLFIILYGLELTFCLILMTWAVKLMIEHMKILSSIKRAKAERIQEKLKTANFTLDDVVTASNVSVAVLSQSDTASAVSTVSGESSVTE